MSTRQGKGRGPKPRLLEMRIELLATESPVWRSFITTDAITLYQLHEQLQVIMGWMNCHLFMFRNGDLTIAEASDDDNWYGGEFRDAEKMTVRELFAEPGDRAAYIYDFGDDWHHALTLHKVMEDADIPQGGALCLAGQGACPPEDCGGPPGFDHLKRAIADPDHEEHDELTAWLSGYYPGYDPAEFPLDEINRRLKIGAGTFLREAQKVYG